MAVKIDVKPLGPKSLAIAVSADEEVCVQWLGRTIFDSTHESLAVPSDDEESNEDEDYEDYQDDDEDYQDENEDNEDGDIHITFADGDDIYHTLLILRLL